MSDAMPDVLLRPFETQAQQDQLGRILADPEVSRHLLVSFHPSQGLAENAARFRRNFAQAWEQMGFGGLLILRPGDETVQGFVALKPHLRDGPPRPGRFEIYFALARAAWGRGLATRALAAFLDELTRRLRPASIHACLDPARNPAARRVLEKQGFVREGEVSLAGYAGPSLARGSLEVELFRLRAGNPGAEMLEQAAERIGQLTAAAGLELPQALREIEDVVRAGGLAARLGSARAREIAERGLAVGARQACYAVFTRTLEPATR